MSVWFLPLGNGLRIVVEGVRPSLDVAIEQDWLAACRANPRLFDGPILAVRSIDLVSGTIAATPERFAHVVCRPAGRSMAVTILSVTGVIGADVAGSPHVLLARRGDRTRSYPGMWEFAPAGGLQATAGRREFGLERVMETLRAELDEEVGVRASLEEARAIGLVADAGAQSVDVVVRAKIAGDAPALEITGEHAWECSEARWISVDGLGETLARLPGGVIEPTAAIARHLDWVD